MGDLTLHANTLYVDICFTIFTTIAMVGKGLIALILEAILLCMTVYCIHLPPAWFTTSQALHKVYFVIQEIK